MTSRSAPWVSRITLIYLAILLVFFPKTPISANITTLLSNHPDFSAFSSLLISTAVSSELERRTSVTLLAVPNSVLHSSTDIDLRAASSSSYLADVLRYHVLLQYLSLSDLQQIPPEGRLVATLYQTTGRAADELGDVNITRSSSGDVTIRSPVPFSSSNASVLDTVTAVPYNVSVFAVNNFIIPYGLDLAASENRPSPQINISDILINGRDFTVAASMFQASGVTEELMQDQRGAGITVFVPTDEAFAGLPRTENLRSLAAEQKSAVLRFHVLHSYYPLGSLESIVNPVQPTLATEDSGAGRFTLNISRGNGSISIDTGIIQASITRTVYDQNPVAVFAVSRVLLPREIFRGTVQGSGASNEVGPPVEFTELSPNGQPESAAPAASSGRVANDGNTLAGWSGSARLILTVFCLLVFLLEM